MLTSIHIQDFKGFKDTQIDTLKRVNLVVGGQNVGKTSLLEAIYLGAATASQLGRVRWELPQLFRSVDSEIKNSSQFGLIRPPTDISYALTPSDRDLQRFFKHLSAGHMQISLGNGQEQQRTYYEGAYAGSLSAAYDLYDGIKLQRVGSDQTFQKPLALSIQLPSQENLATLFSEVSDANKEIKLIELLRKIEPRLITIAISALKNDTRVMVNLKDIRNKLPLALLGHGFSRLLHLYCSLLITESKLTLIDEIENGIHYSALKTVFEGVKDIAQTNDVQSFITTHSIECIRAAYEVFQNSLDDFQVIRLEQQGDNVKAVVIDGENLQTFMIENYEIR